ncbi:response regulator transcription factor [Mesorhizobium sp. WSM3224]|uniref:response regulator transcription factor n=1 Tax=Mesorhizobium sp. WSM3224 TaxID=1040986 RepID=UPI000487ABBA|nr:response regulator transcription factor [Mesorhizobium sp. WSM3224]
MKPVVLICSQDAEFYLFFSHVLEVDGFATELASTDNVIRHATEREPEAVVLDCQPGSATGLGICARLKGALQTDALPVIALIAAGAEHQQLELLEAGIDETFLRPFAPAKLLSYLSARLRTKPLNSNGDDDAGLLICGELKMQLGRRRVHCNGQQLHLGPLEFSLLRYLIENPGKVCSRDELVSAAWPANIHVGARTVDVHISRLRKTLSPYNVIRTIRSVGYALEEQEI